MKRTAFVSNSRSKTGIFEVPKNMERHVPQRLILYSSFHKKQIPRDELGHDQSEFIADIILLVLVAKLNEAPNVWRMFYRR